MIVVTPSGSPEPCRSEQTFHSHITDTPGVLLANVNIPNSSAPSAFTREADGVAITPFGIYTVEVKGLRAEGELQTSRMDAWSVVNGDNTIEFKGRPHAQALMHSKYLASFLKDHSIVSGWVAAVLAIVGDDITLPGESPVLLTDNVHVVISSPQVGETITEHVLLPAGAPEVSLETALALLDAFECRNSGPTLQALLAQGFRTEAVIEEEIDTKRAQAREEYTAALQSQDSTQGTTTAETLVMDAPSTLDWRITQDRFIHTQTVDADLTEVGAFTSGVPMHKRLVSFATRKKMTLEDVATVVTHPEHVWGDDTDQNQIFCGNGLAVTVRTLDGVALYYKDYDIAYAELHGKTVLGVEITPRAAKNALGHMDISLEAVARMVTHAEERWWIPGGTDVAHARGDMVAVTAGLRGPVLYIQSRALAVARTTPKPATETPEDTPKAQMVGDYLIQEAATNWCRRRHIPLPDLATVIEAPSETWAGHSENMEIRRHDDHSVAALVNTADKTVVSIMPVGEALDYRDGITRDGVRLSGRCLFRARRRRVAIEALIEAHKNPEIIARAPGGNETYYVGQAAAIAVDDRTGEVTDFTYPEHLRRRIRKGDLVQVSPANETPGQTPSAKPDPKVFAAMAQAASRGPVTRATGPAQPSTAPSTPSPLLMPARKMP